MLQHLFCLETPELLPFGEDVISMDLRTELLINKPLQAGHELALALLLTREYAARYMEERIFRPGGISDQQFNVLRILRGGPKEGYLVCEVKRRMISRNADVPRLIDRLVKQGLVRRKENPTDRRGTRVQITPKGSSTAEEIGPKHAEAMERFAAGFSEAERQQLVSLLERLRSGFGEALETEQAVGPAATPKGPRRPNSASTPRAKRGPGEG
jgi:DNA-binding MarR family transcriptional regulator